VNVRLRRGLFVSAIVLLTVFCVAVPIAAAPLADARLTLEATGAPPVAGGTFVVSAAVESVPVPNGPAFDWTVALTLPAGIEFVTVVRGMPTVPQCSVAGGVVTCRGRNIGGEITSSTTLRLRAGAAGQYTIRGTAAIVGQADTNPANDSAELSVTVAAAPPATARCLVPNVVRRTLAAARTALVRAGCRVGSVRNAPSATVARGRIVSQSPKAGRRVARGTRVSLVVSRGG
jgi:PASTA domain-containing protein